MAGFEKITFNKVKTLTLEQLQKLQKAVSSFADYEGLRVDIQTGKAEAYQANNGALIVIEQTAKDKFFVCAVSGKGGIKALKVVRAIMRNRGFKTAEFITQKPHLCRLLNWLKVEKVEQTECGFLYQVTL